MMQPALYTLIALAGLLQPAPATAQATPPCAACVVVTVAPGQAAMLPASLGGSELLVRVRGGAESDAAEALLVIAQRGGRPGLLVEGLPGPELPSSVVTSVGTVIVVLDDLHLDADALAFELKKRLTGIRGAASGTITLGVSAPPDVLTALIARDLAAYIDVVITRGAPGADMWATIGAEQWLDAGDLTQVPAAVITAGRLGAVRTIWRGPDDSEALRDLMRDLAGVTPLLPYGLVPDAGLRVACGDRLEQSWMNPVSLDRVALVSRCVPAAIRTWPDSGAAPVVLSTGDVLVRVPAPSADHFADSIQVSGARELTVEEIVARHQAVAARQTALVRTLISNGTQTLTFEAPGFPAPIAITSEVVIYSDGARTEIEQQNILVNGIAFRGRGVPRLPLLEPERVASPPLAITLTELYRYRLQGRETVADTICYVVAFEPAVQGPSLFSGRAWIAADSFAMIRATATQTGLRGPIVSSEQTDEFRRDGEGVWLLARSNVRQMYEGPAHRTPIQRVLEIHGHEVNPELFVERRQAAYASDSVMLRDTPQGYRYLRRVGTPSERGSGGSSGTVSGSATEEEGVTLAGRANRVRTFALGVLIDPNITRPLPFAGLSYVDFDLFGTGAQLNGFFGGSYGQLAVSVPSIRGTSWRLAGRAFGIASAFNDRAFSDGREHYGDNILQRPAHGSVWALRPLTPRLAVRTGYDFDYTWFDAGDTTSGDFIVPAHQVVHGLRVGLEGQRNGWNGAIWWNPARRTGWRSWGRPQDYAPRHHEFQRYGASVSRSAVLTPELVARGEALWMSGHDLDRFSRYSFGAFDNRLRGYPSGLIRYDRGAVFRGAVAWAAARHLRLDGFLDSAYVHDPGLGSRPTRLTGLGIAIEAPAPFGTLLAVEWGFGLQGVNTDGARGTHVVRISGYKVF